MVVLLDAIHIHHAGPLQWGWIIVIVIIVAVRPFFMGEPAWMRTRGLGTFLP
jgi:hypothetical protein